MTAPLLCTVDVGTGSARAGIIDAGGHLLGRAAHPIAIRRCAAAMAEHNSDDIWHAVCASVRGALAASGARPSDIAALGFGATCSLVARGVDGGSVPVGIDGAPGWDTIAWLDHRAVAEAHEAARHDKSAGASPEMQTPKLMWLKRHLPAVWDRTAHLFDLADFLTWRATGADARSACTMICKWGWGADGAAPDALLSALGLADLPLRAGLPGCAAPVGASVGGLTPAAADALGLPVGLPVAAGMIDAYAGALGVLGGLPNADLADRAALIAGTSSCIMTLSPAPHAIPGLWGPYRGVTLPGMWAAEGGQSAAGGLLDHIVRQHGAGLDASEATHAAIAARVAQLRAAQGDAFAADIHVVPDFHGARSPFSDPGARGMIVGLDLDGSFDALCALWWRAAVGLALGLGQIVDHMHDHGRPTAVLRLGGGHARSPLLAQLYADATGRAVQTAPGGDAMLLGAAICAAAAGGVHPSLRAAAIAMAPGMTRRDPDPARRSALAHDRRVLAKLQALRRDIAGLRA